jgi:UDP-N-acetylglucosamine--N-acetylmuramyl-(pentapeptide) pyrophosphoryl-undecaprenol N-acetylglucosamine transferase
LVQRGAAVSVPDDQMLGAGAAADGPLMREVRRLLINREARARMAQASAALARPDAANHLADELLQLAGVGGVRA